MNSNENHHNSFFKTLDLVSPETKRRVRIADILTAGEAEGSESLGGDLGVLEMDGVVSRRRRGGGISTASLQCASPRRIIARCLAVLRPARERKPLFGCQESEGATIARELSGVSSQSHASCSTNLPCNVDSPASAPEIDNSGRCRTEASFNLGVACGLLYIIGVSRNEMSKMVEVRKQMEMLLQNFKEEFQSKNSPFKTIEPNDVNLVSSSSEPPVSAQMNSPWTTSYVVPESEIILECDGDSSQSDVDGIEHQPAVGMDELEAELEAELELLEINLDTGHSSEIPQQRMQKVVMDTSSSSSCSESQSQSSGEIIIDTQEICTDVQREVSPIELERRLHELLEARQQERIQELEEALECTKRKLREKELEVSWWKDTATIISHHVPESPRIVTQQNLKTLHLSR